MIRKFLPIALIAIYAISALPAQASGYIKLGDIDGESSDVNHQNWSDILSVSMQTVDSQSDDKRSQSAAPRFGDIVIVKEWDASAPKLQEKVVTEEVIPYTLIEIFDEQKRLRQVYEIFDVLISSYSNHAHGGSDGSRPMESFSLNYEKARIIAFPLSAEQPPVEWYYSRTGDQ